MAGVKFVNNSANVRQAIGRNKTAALNAMGIKAVGLIVQQMQSAYGKPIRQTGDLMRDVNFEVGRSSPDTVDVGNSLEYARFVHEGTSRMRGRAYIRDALMAGENALQAVAQNELKKGF